MKPLRVTRHDLPPRAFSGRSASPNRCGHNRQSSLATGLSAALLARAEDPPYSHFTHTSYHHGDDRNVPGQRLKRLSGMTAMAVNSTSNSGSTKPAILMPVDAGP